MNDKLQTLKDLVKIDSSKNQDEIIDYIVSRLNGKAKDILIGQNKEYLLVGINTPLNNVEPIVLSGHIDTVNPVDASKFDVKTEAGRAYGLGIIDMKCFTSTIIDNFEKIKALDYPVICVFTTDEETKLQTIISAIEKLITQNITPQFSIIGEPSNMNFATRSKGCSEYEINVQGVPCHSSKPENGVNAICIMAKLVSFIENLSKCFAETTLNPGVISGGDIVNRVAGNAKLNFDIRTYDENEKQIALTEIASFMEALKAEYPGCEMSIENKLEIPSFCLKNTELVKSVAENFGNKLIDFSGGCEAGYFTSYSGDAVIYGVGEMSLCHQANENIVVSDYLEYQKTFLQFLSAVKDNLKGLSPTKNASFEPCK